MVRTSQRPLVLGVNKNVALFNGIVLGAAGIAGLMQYSYLTAGLGLTVWAGYLFVYTRMKQTT